MRPLLLSLLSASALAGPAFFPGQYAGGRFAPDAQPGGFEVRFSETRVQVDGDEAVVRTESRVRARTPGLRSIGLLPLPDGVGADGVHVRVDGAAVGRFLPAAEAAKVYAEVARGAGASALLGRVGAPAWLLPEVRLGAATDLVVELRLPVGRDAGLRTLTLPMPAADLAAGVRKVRVEVELHAERPLRAVFSPSHEVEVARPVEHAATVRLRAERLQHAEPLRLFWAVDDDALGLRVLTHRAEGEDVGYLMLLGNPSGAQGPVIPKDVVLALDTSGSMRGEKLEQVRSAVEYVLEHLNPTDRFNLVAFGTEVRRFRPDLVPSTADTREAARRFVEDLVAHGRTNIAGALEAGLAGTPGARPRTLLFLTDGAPTAGERDPKRVISSLPGLNRSGARVFVLGVGHDVNAHLLDQIAEQTGGSTVYVDPDDGVDVKVAALYDGLSNPVLADVGIDFGGLEVEHVYPAELPTLFRGQELLVLGRYRGGGPATITLRGSLAGEPREHAVRATLPDTAAPGHDFVASLWAARRIGELLKRLRLGGDEATRKDLVGEVVELSRRFGILTEYTEFISADERDYSLEDATARATAEVSTANAQQSGRWAVRQAANERELRTKKVSSAAANLYVDRKGRVKRAAKVRSVGRRAFYKRGEKWVQADDGRARKKRRVKRFSAEYMRLLEQDKDFARAQTLDGDMEINLGDERVEVY